MPGEVTLGPENRPVTIQNWLAGTIVGTMVTIVLMMFVPGWLVFTDESTNVCQWEDFICLYAVY